MVEQFRGSYGVTITPFTEDGKKIDVPAWKRFIDWQISEGSPGIIILGTTGEFLTLTDDERTQFVEATIKHVRKRIHVLVGTMNAYTPNAVRYSREAEKLGADGLMIIPPTRRPRTRSTPTTRRSARRSRSRSCSTTIPTPRMSTCSPRWSRG
jgi:4-hydroxy-tetrahydrodipicolinate synthase